jgi:hypothetical protein
MGGWTTGQSMLRMGSGDQGPQGQQVFGGDAGVVRPSSTTPGMGGGGFDSSYLQNLATSSGGNFMRPQGGALNFNPLGNLNDIQSNPLGGGNAPLFGLPQTLQQNAQANAPTPPSPSVTPPPPTPASLPALGMPGTPVPNAPANSGLQFGPTGVPLAGANSALGQAIWNYLKNSGFNFTGGQRPPDSLLAQFGLASNPQGGFMLLNPPTTGGT